MGAQAEVIVVEGEPRVEAVTVSSVYAELHVDTTTIPDAGRVVLIEFDREAIFLRRAEAYDLALALLGRLGLIGFPGVGE